MKSVTATRAKNNFGLLLEFCAESPVAVERHGRVVAYLVAPKDFNPEARDLFISLAMRLRSCGAVYATVFGSIAQGEQQFGSDLDLAVSTGSVLRPQQRLKMVDAAAQLAGRSVDLIDLEEARGLIFTRAMQGREILCIDAADRQRLISRLIRARTDRRVTSMAAAASRAALFAQWLLAILTSSRQSFVKSPAELSG